MELSASHTVVLPLVTWFFLVFFSCLYFFCCPAIIAEHRVESWAITIRLLPLYFQPPGWQVHFVPRTSCHPQQSAPMLKKRLSFGAIFRVEFLCCSVGTLSVYWVCLCESQAAQARSRALKIAWWMTYTSTLKLLWDEFTSLFCISPQDTASAKLIALKIIITIIKKRWGFGALVVLQPDLWWVTTEASCESLSLPGAWVFPLWIECLWFLWERSATIISLDRNGIDSQGWFIISEKG